MFAPELLRRMDSPGPRYTSYPTADRFVEAFGPAAYRQALRQRAAAGNAPLALYVHIPFCEQLCWYCACNKIVTRQHARGAEYLKLLQQEVRLHQAELGTAPLVSQISLGGGSPTFLSDGELGELMQMLRGAFRVLPGAELSIEVDPRTASPQRLHRLAALGFNRISFGVQDFDADVQLAIHRVQPLEQVRDLVDEARTLRFTSINADLIYGLPRQTAESFARTIEQVVDVRPTRIALYAYAHLPQRFKAQRRIDVAALPPPMQRLQMLQSAITGFLRAGYEYIGMDHFALPGDALAIARRQGRLHRNFQGYTTQPDGDLIGLGVSAIGRVGATYSQNAKALDEYRDAMALGEFAVQRGLALSRDDLLRRAVIMALMCQGCVDIEAMGTAHLVDLRQALAAEFEALQPLQDAGLVDITEHAVQVTAKGWYFVRSVAMVFDRYLQADRQRERYSRVI